MMLESRLAMIHDILNHEGKDLRLYCDILQEECAELIKALSKLKRFGLDEDREDLRMAIVEELVHVRLSSELLAVLMDIKSSEQESKWSEKYGQMRRLWSENKTLFTSKKSD